MPRKWNCDLSTGDFSQPGGTETGGTFDGSPPLKDTIQVAQSIDGLKPPPGKKYMAKFTVRESDGAYGGSSGRRCLTRQYDESEWSKNLRYPGYDSALMFGVMLPADYPALGGNWWVNPMEFHHTSGNWVAPIHGVFDGNQLVYNVRGGNEGNVPGNIKSIDQGFPINKRLVWHYLIFRTLHDPVNGAVELLHAQDGDSDFRSLISKSGIPTMYRNTQSYLAFGMYTAIISGLATSMYFAAGEEWDTVAECVASGKSMLTGVAPPDPGPIPNPTPVPVKATSNIQSDDTVAPGEPWRIKVHHDAQKCEYYFDDKLLGTDAIADTDSSGDDIYEILIPNVSDGPHKLGFTVYGAQNNIMYQVGPYNIKTKVPPVQIDVPAAIGLLQTSLSDYFVGWSGHKKPYTVKQAKTTRVYQAVKKLGGKWEE